MDGKSRKTTPARLMRSSKAWRSMRQRVLKGCCEACGTTESLCLFVPDSEVWRWDHRQIAKVLWRQTNPDIIMVEVDCCPRCNSRQLRQRRHRFSPKGFHAYLVCCRCRNSFIEPKVCLIEDADDAIEKFKIWTRRNIEHVAALVIDPTPLTVVRHITLAGSTGITLCRSCMVKAQKHIESGRVL